MYFRFVFTLSLLSLLALPCTWATSYYFAANGDDSAATSSPSSPWQTITKLNSIASTLTAGDSVLFNKGDTFRGQITFSASGTASSPITFSSYGTSTDLPTIKGSVPVSSGWSLYSGSIYQTSVTSAVTQVFYNGDLMTLARYPNTGFLRTSEISGLDLTCANLTQASDYFNNATVRLRTTNWSYDNCLVSKYVSHPSGGVLTLANSFSNIAITNSTPGWGFYLDNKLTLLDAPGEWFFNSSSMTLYFWMPNSANPNGANVDATVENYGIYGSNTNANIFIKNLRFTQQESAAVYAPYHAANYTVDNCQFSFQNLRGVYFQSAKNMAVSNSAFSNINGQAISYVSVNSSLIWNNNVIYVGLIAGKGVAGTGGIAGISVGGGMYNSVMYNRVSQIGYIGIRYDGGYHHVEGNVVDWCMLTLDDGGGIYSFGYPSTGSVIKNNVISNIYPNVESTPSWNTLGEAHGLYLDDYSNNQTILNNTIYNCLTSALYIHDSPNNIVKYNVLYNSTYAQLSFFDQFLDGATYNNIIDHNYLLAALPGQLLIQEYTLFENTNRYATYTNNQYASPYTAIQFQAQTNPKNVSYVSFYDWVSIKKDTSDVLSPFISFPRQSLINYIGDNLVPPTATAKSFACYSPVSGCTITNITSPLCSFPNNTPSTCMNLTAPNGAADGKPIWYEASMVVFASSRHDFFIVPRQNHNPYTSLTPQLASTLQANQAQKIVLYFTPLLSDTNARLDIQTTADIHTISFSQVTVRAANVQAINLQETTGIIVNPSNVTVEAGPLRNGLAHYDLLGNKYTFPIRLAPLSSVLVIFNGTADPTATGTTTSTPSTSTPSTSTPSTSTPSTFTPSTSTPSTSTPSTSTSTTSTTQSGTTQSANATSSPSISGTTATPISVASALSFSVALLLGVFILIIV